MKKFFSIINFAFMLLLTLNGFAQQTCGISPLGGFCQGSTIQYYAGGRLNPQVTINPSGAGFVSVSGNYFTITWSNSFAISGCEQNVSVTVANTDGSNPCTTDPAMIKVHKKPILSIGGNTTISAVNGWTNEYQTTTYTLSGSCFGGVSSWTVPAGWDIVSPPPHNGTSIDVKPSPGAACNGIIKVKVFYGNGCYEEKQLSVSLNPLAFGYITNHLQTTGSWPPLEICLDDDIILDAQLTNFCNSSQNIYLEWMQCTASWGSVISANGAWLSPPQYAALGGLSWLNVRAFMTNVLLLPMPPPGYYKLKLAVGGGLPWNERTMYIQIKPRGVPAPISFIAMNATPKGAASGTARPAWDGNTANEYEILYETSDSPLFLHPGTTTTSTGCFTTPLSLPPTVFTTIPGLPLGYHFRYKVRECPCGVWTSWSNTIVLQPAMDIAEINKEEGMNITSAPNPFNDNLSITFNLPSETEATIRMIDITGRQIKLIEAKKYSIGENRVDIDANDIAAGLYHVIIKTNTGSYVHKVLCSK